MIEELRIRSLGVIDQASIPLGPGLTVLTGETGAGKTMVLTGLDLIRGGRADAGLVRAGSDRAEVEGQWLLPEGAESEVLARVEEAGGVVDALPEGALLILGRLIGSTGRSRAVAGGRTVPAGVLGDLTDRLVAVHGQADQLQLRDARRQRELIDRFGGLQLASCAAEFAALLIRYRQAVRDRDEIRARGQEWEREAALLRHGIDEIEAVDPREGEDADLKAQATLLAGVTDVLDATSAAHLALVGGEGSDAGAVDLLAAAVRELHRAEALDPSLAPLVADLQRAMDSLVALAGEVAAHAASLDADPRQLAEVEERRRRLSDLKRRYGPELDDVLRWRAEAEHTVGIAEGSGERLAHLDAEIVELAPALVSAAEALTSARIAAASEFAERVTAELRELAMADAFIEVTVTPSADMDAWTSAGADDVAILLAPHRGSQPRPIGSGASGGELSRVMLAIEVVLAGRNPVPTFVFDEVDAGIGGRVAVEVGRRLARLAGSAQVLVVTHLPQVAAFADTHIVVSKDSDGHVTAASVVAVEGQDRVRELVRMLSGLEGSASGAEHAAELLELAAAERSGG